MPGAQFTRFAEKLYHKSWPALKRAARRFRWCGRPTPAGPCRRRLKRSPPLRSSRVRTPRTTSRHRLHTGGSVRSRLLMALIFGLVCRRGKSRSRSLRAKRAAALALTIVRGTPYPVTVSFQCSRPRQWRKPTAGHRPLRCRLPPHRLQHQQFQTWRRRQQCPPAQLRLLLAPQLLRL